MIVQAALQEQLREIMDFYDFMCREIGKASYLPQGNKGGFPSLEMVSDAIEHGELYIGLEDGMIMAAYIMNHGADPVYDQAPWQVEAPAEKVSVLHALRVHPRYSGRGYATQLVGHAIETAREKEQTVLRLDCMEENLAAQKIYGSHGFQYIHTAEIFYQDIGVPKRCMMFEKQL